LMRHMYMCTCVFFHKIHVYHRRYVYICVCVYVFIHM